MIPRPLIDFINRTRRILLSPFVLKDLFTFRQTKGAHRFTTHFSDFYPCIKDKTVKTNFDRHYIYHTSWAARVVREVFPSFHVDISSSLYFSGIVSAFVPVRFYDYRPADLALSNLTSEKGDLLNLPFKDKSIKSISCMHTIEHVGLGRYGDQIEAEGDLKAIAELKRVVAPGGHLILVLPVGKPRIEFNAHRIYSYEQVMEMFNDPADDAFELKEFTFIPEYAYQGPIIRNANPALVKNAHYACGCFWFVRRSAPSSSREQNSTT